jgi:hypothetical protein
VAKQASAQLSACVAAQPAHDSCVQAFTPKVNLQQTLDRVPSQAGVEVTKRNLAEVEAAGELAK